MITIICPVKNEELYIDQLVNFFLSSLPVNKELILIDGSSTDRTREIIERYAKQHSNIRMLENPKGFVPFALNAAITQSSGDPVIRLDAHTRFAPDYFVKILETFDRTNADIVGGPMRAEGTGSFQKAVAYCTSTKFGVGDSGFHYEMKEGYVDSVYLGAFRRSIFSEVGLFDEDMLRNQDDEFNYRAKSKGKKIYLNPEIHSVYFPRDSVSKLFKQYFQYGLFKPLVLQKVKSGMRIRHLIPAMFVLFVAASLLLYDQFSCLIDAVYLLYFAINAIFSFRNSFDWQTKCNCFITYFILHVSYGLGFILGTLNLRKLFLR